MTAPDFVRAQQAAEGLLLRSAPDSLPVSPLALLSAMARVYTYEEMAAALDLPLAQVEADCGGADAFTIRQGEQTVVAYRTDGNPARRNFTLAHEIAHIVLGHAEMTDAHEKEADHFASCLLAPAAVVDWMRRTLGDDCAAALPRLLYVSPACARQALKRQNFLKNSENYFALEAKFGLACRDFCLSRKEFRVKCLPKDER